jgi:hypothetical protein
MILLALIAIVVLLGVIVGQLGNAQNKAWRNHRDGDPRDVDTSLWSQRDSAAWQQKHGLKKG